MKSFIFKIIVAWSIQGMNICLMAYGNPVINQNDSVIFDLSQASCASELVTFPVWFSSDDPIYAVDFAMKFDPGDFTFLNITNVQSGLVTSAYFNIPDSTLRFTSYSGTPMLSGSPLISLRFSLPGNLISALNFDTVTAILNGDACSYGFISTFLPMSILVTGPPVLYPGDSAILTVNASPGLNYLWSTGQSAWQIVVNQPGTYSVSVSAIQGCSSMLSIVLQTNNPLPVELLYFRGKQVQQQVMLEWATASEFFSSHFIVERFSQSGQWDRLDSVSAAGFATGINNYHSMDQEPLSGSGLYRLLQVDRDGLTETFDAIKIPMDYSQRTATIWIAPNPYDPESGVIPTIRIIDVETNGRVDVIDAAGKRVYSVMINKSDKDFMLFLGRYPVSGNYHVVFTGDAKRFSTQWLIR